MKQIAVIGAGTMGNGIAHVFAQSGFSVNLIDISEAQLAKGMETIQTNLARQVKKGTISATDEAAILARILPVSNFVLGVSEADLIIEAVAESEKVKSEVFKALDEATKPEAILASITALSARSAEPMAPSRIFPPVTASDPSLPLVTARYTSSVVPTEEAEDAPGLLQVINPLESAERYRFVLPDAGGAGGRVRVASALIAGALSNIKFGVPSPLS